MKEIVALAALMSMLGAPAQAQTDYQKKLAQMAADDAALRKSNEEMAREARRPPTAREKQDAFNKLCTIKPVMTDVEIDRCRQAYKAQ